MLCSKKVSIKNEGQIKITEKQNNNFFPEKAKIIEKLSPVAQEAQAVF